MVPIPAVSIITHNGRLTLVKEVLNSHKEDALVDSLKCCSCFFTKLSRPQLTMVIIVASIALKTPRVSHFDQSVSVRELDGTEDNVSMGSL